MTIYLAVIIGLPVALTLATVASAPLWGALTDRWEQRRRTRALDRQVDAQEAALWVLARVEQDRADALILRTAERFALDVSFATTAAQIDALETTEERA